MNTTEAILSVSSDEPQTMMEIHAARKALQGERLFPVKGTLVTMIKLDELRRDGKVRSTMLADDDGASRLVWVRHKPSGTEPGGPDAFKLV